MTPPPALTAVMPAYNEEAGIAGAVAEVRERVLDAVPGSDLVVVDDGSSDGTGRILDELAGSDGRVTVIHGPNRGHGRALRAGLDAARGDFLFLLDSDRQIPLEAFPELWAAAGTVDGAFGVRARRRDPLHRRVLTAVVRAVVNLLFRVSLRDANAPFKVVRRSLWLELRERIPADALAPSLFLAVLAAARGCRLEQVEVPHRPRATGTPSLRPWKLLGFCARAFVQLLALRRGLRG